MYIVTYSWSRTIISSREMDFTWTTPPFGIVFASLMCSLTLGSFCASHLSRNGTSVQMASSVVQLALSTASVSLLLAAWAHREVVRFWALCLFEVCVGTYLPSIAYLKGTLVGDEQRGMVYGYMRIPLNVFAVLSLITMGEGKSYHCSSLKMILFFLLIFGADASWLLIDEETRENRFIVCGFALLMATFVMARYVPQTTRPT